MIPISPMYLNSRLTLELKSRLQEIRKLKKDLSARADKVLETQINRLPPTQHWGTDTELHLFRRVYTEELEAFVSFSNKPAFKSTSASSHRSSSSSGKASTVGFGSGSNPRSYSQLPYAPFPYPRPLFNPQARPLSRSRKSSVP
jgi:hypothetical protein